MSWPYVPAYHHSGGSNLTPTRVVIHCTVSPCTLGGAMGTARYFQSPGSGGSAHKVADPGGVVVCARDDVICWHAPPNQRSLGIELCDPMTGPASRWQDASHQSMLRIAAVEVRNWCLTYGIPITKIGPPDLVRGQRGNCGHIDVSNAWHETDHWDPGPDFPWTQFIGLVIGAAPTQTAPDVLEDIMAALTPAELDQHIMQMCAQALRSDGVTNNAADVRAWIYASWWPSTIARLYQTYLHRAPDPTGLATWVAAAKNGAKYVDIEAAIAGSPEARRATA